MEEMGEEKAQQTGKAPYILPAWVYRGFLGGLLDKLLKESVFIDIKQGCKVLLKQIDIPKRRSVPSQYMMN